jgi:hypothetical protein
MAGDKQCDPDRRFEEAASAVLRVPKKAVDRALTKERKARERRMKRTGSKAGRTKTS